MNLFILLLMALCYQSSDSGRIHAGIHNNFRPISKRSTRLWRRQDDFGYLEQCSILQFWDKQIGRVNVLAFFDSSWQFSHRQATMLRILRERFERTGFDNIQFFAVNAPPGMAQFIDQSEIVAEEEAWRQISPSEAEVLPEVQLTPESLAEALGPYVYFIQDDERLQIWAKLRALRDQILVIDRCGRLTYQIIVPWSILHFPYVKAAILSTYKDEPCGYCQFQETGPDTVTTETPKDIPEAHHRSSEISSSQTVSQESITSTEPTEKTKTSAETFKEGTTSTIQNENTKVTSEISDETTQTTSTESIRIVQKISKVTTASIDHDGYTETTFGATDEATTSTYLTENTDFIFGIFKEATASSLQEKRIKVTSETLEETTISDQNKNTGIILETESPLVITDYTGNDNSSSVVTEESSSAESDRFDDEADSSTFEPLLKNQTNDDQDGTTNYDQSVISTLRPDAPSSSSGEPSITDRTDESTIAIASLQSDEQSTYAPENEYTDAPTLDDYLSVQTDVTENNDTTWASDEQSTPVYRSNDLDTVIPDDLTIPMNLMESTVSTYGSPSEEETTMSTENYTSLVEDLENQTDAGPVFRTSFDGYDPLALNNAFEDEFFNSTNADYSDDYSNSTSAPQDIESTTDGFATSNDIVTDKSTINLTTTGPFLLETNSLPSEASTTTEREELRLTDETDIEDSDDIDIKSRSTNARSVPAENSSRNSIEVSEVDSELSEEQLTSPDPDYVLPIRIIMRAPHVDEYSDRSMKAHEYLVLKTGQPEYHDHLDELAHDGLGYVDDQQQQQQQQVPRPETIVSGAVKRTFGKDESPGLYGEVADYWRKIGNELDRTSTQLSADDDYDEDLGHETNFTVGGIELKPSASPQSNDENYGNTVDVSESPPIVQEENQTGSDKNKNQETDPLEDDYDTDEEAKSQLIAHYSKLLPWLYYVLAK